MGCAGSGPAAADGGVGARHVVACRLHLLAVAVGLLVDHLEVPTQLGDELLASHGARATPEVTGSQHIANDGLVLLLQGSGLGTDQRAVGVDITELVTDRHLSVLLIVEVYAASGVSCSESAERPVLGSRSCSHRGSSRRAPRAACSQCCGTRCSSGPWCRTRWPERYHSSWHRQCSGSTPTSCGPHPQPSARAHRNGPPSTASRAGQS